MEWLEWYKEGAFLQPVVLQCPCEMPEILQIVNVNKYLCTWLTIQFYDSEIQAFKGKIHPELPGN